MQTSPLVCKRNILSPSMRGKHVSVVLYVQMSFHTCDNLLQFNSYLRPPFFSPDLILRGGVWAEWEIGVFGGEKEGDGVRSRPGEARAARTILRLHIISAMPSSLFNPFMVRTFLKVYMELLFFVSARTNKRHHHHLVPTAYSFSSLLY